MDRTARHLAQGLGEPTLVSLEERAPHRVIAEREEDVDGDE